MRCVAALICLVSTLFCSPARPQQPNPDADYKDVPFDQLIDKLPKTERAYSSFNGDITRLVSTILSKNQNIKESFDSGQRQVWSTVKFGIDGGILKVSQNLDISPASGGIEDERNEFTVKANRIKRITAHPFRSALGVFALDKEAYIFYLELPEGISGVRFTPRIRSTGDLIVERMEKSIVLYIACDDMQADRIALALKKVIESYGAEDVELVTLADQRKTKADDKK